MAKKGRDKADVKRRQNKPKDFSTSTVLVMVILVLIVTFFSLGLYIYNLSHAPTSAEFRPSGTASQIGEMPVASGKATIQIIKPPESEERS